MTAPTTARPAAARPAVLALAALLAAPAAADAQIGDLFSRGADAVRRQAGRPVSTSVELEDVDLATLRGAAGESSA